MSKVGLDGVVIAEIVDTLHAAEQAIEAVRGAFGAPGDYGYSTSKGDALFKLYALRAGLAQEAARLSATGFCAEAWTIVPIIDEPGAAR